MNVASDTFRALFTGQPTVGLPKVFISNNCRDVRNDVRPNIDLVAMRDKTWSAAFSYLCRRLQERYGKICTTRDIINMRFRRRKNLERQVNEEQSSLSYSSNRHHHQEQHSTRSNLEPLAEVCCRLVLDDEEEVEEEEDTCIPPMSHDAQKICVQQTTIAGDEQLNISVHSMLRNLTQVWRQNRDEKDRNLRYNHT
ncbi:hypothetical protein ACTXT7_015561 [Hymenolepis weldensis]